VQELLQLKGSDPECEASLILKRYMAQARFLEFCVSDTEVDFGSQPSYSSEVSL
jgi:hypothetical protein